MDEQYNYFKINNSSEESVRNEDMKFMEENSKQMLTLVNIINAYTAETNALKQQISDLNSMLENCEDNKFDGNDNESGYFTLQNIIFLIILLLLIILIYFQYVKK